MVIINTDTDSIEEAGRGSPGGKRHDRRRQSRSEREGRASGRTAGAGEDGDTSNGTRDDRDEGAMKDGRDGKPIEITTASSGDPEQAKPKQRARTPVDETKARRTVQPTKRAASTGGAKGQPRSEPLGKLLGQIPQRVDGRRQPDAETSSSPTEPILTKPTATKPGPLARSKQTPAMTGRSTASRGTRPPTEAPARGRNPNHNDSPPQGRRSDRDQGVQQ